MKYILSSASCGCDGNAILKEYTQLKVYKLSKLMEITNFEYGEKPKKMSIYYIEMDTAEDLSILSKNINRPIIIEQKCWVFYATEIKRPTITIYDGYIE